MADEGKSKKKRAEGLITFAATFCLAWALFSTALMLSLMQTWLYPHLAKDRVNSRNLSEETVRANYRTLIRYNLQPGGKPLRFDGLPMSERGRSHFAEVKNIFQGIFVSGVAAWSAVAVFSWRIKKTGGSFTFLLYAFRISLLFLALLLLPLLGGFARAFVVFHQLLFNNDNWIFDSAVDPVIDYLPSSFFRNMALVILFHWILLLFVLRFVLYPSLVRKGSRRQSHTGKESRRTRS